MKIRKTYFPVTQRIHTLGKRGEQKQRYKEIITFEFENRGLRLTTSSIWRVGGHLVVEFEHGVRGREKLARNPKGCPPA